MPQHITLERTARTTIRRAKLYRVNGYGERLANCPHLRDFPELELACWFSPADALLFGNSPNLRHLERLIVWLGGYSSLGAIPSEDLVRQFAASSAWPNLRELVLFNPWTGADTGRLAEIADTVAGRPLARVLTPPDQNLLPFHPEFHYFCPGKLPDGRRMVAKPLEDRIHVIVFGDDHRAAEEYDIPAPASVVKRVEMEAGLYGGPKKIRQAIHAAVGSVPAFIRVFDGWHWPDEQDAPLNGPDYHHERWSCSGRVDPDDEQDERRDPEGRGGTIGWIIANGEYGCSGGWCDKSGMVHST